MGINRAFQISSAVVLAVLIAVVGLAPQRVTPRRVEAQDATWSVLAGRTEGGAAAIQADDTTC